MNEDLRETAYKASIMLTVFDDAIHEKLIEKGMCHKSVSGEGYYYIFPNGTPSVEDEITLWKEIIKIGKELLTKL